MIAGHQTWKAFSLYENFDKNFQKYVKAGWNTLITNENK